MYIYIYMYKNILTSRLCTCTHVDYCVGTSTRQWCGVHVYVQQWRTRVRRSIATSCCTSSRPCTRTCRVFTIRYSCRVCSSRSLPCTSERVIFGENTTFTCQSLAWYPVPLFGAVHMYLYEGDASCKLHVLFNIQLMYTYSYLPLFVSLRALVAGGVELHSSVCKKHTRI